MKRLELGAAAMLLALCAAGCSPKPKRTSASAQAPPLQGTQTPPVIPQQKPESPPKSSLPQPSAQSVPPQLPPPPKHRVKHPRHKKPSPPASSSSGATQTASAQTGAASPAASGAPNMSSPSSSTPIGELTVGDSAVGEQSRNDTVNLIQDTERRLAQVKRPLSNEEQVTDNQIRTFLKQARQALNSGDTDGAHTLATKAKLLLDELTK